MVVSRDGVSTHPHSEGLVQRNRSFIGASVGSSKEMKHGDEEEDLVEYVMVKRGLDDERGSEESE